MAGKFAKYYAESNKPKVEPKKEQPSSVKSFKTSLDEISETEVPKKKPVTDDKVKTEQAEKTKAPVQEEQEPEVQEEQVQEPEQVQEQQISRETMLILEAFDRLIDKIDKLASNPPEVHIPAPIVEVTLPETRRTVQKIVERDENGLIKSVTENVTDEPQGDVLSETKKRK